jgi:hypothetical protein
MPYTSASPSDLAFEKKVRERAEVWGLTIPRWTPDWEKVPEDAVISG